MVTKVTGRRNQVNVRSSRVTVGWEQLIKEAAKRCQVSFSDFMIDASTAAALKALETEPQTLAELQAAREPSLADLRAKLEHLEGMLSERPQKRKLLDHLFGRQQQA